jgi:hypothetical protein
VPEYARVLTAIDLATLMLVRPYFMSFQHFLTIRIPTSLQQFVSATSGDIALRLGDPDVFCSYRVDSFQARSAAWVPTLGY